MKFVGTHTGVNKINELELKGGDNEKLNTGNWTDWTFVVHLDVH